MTAPTTKTPKERAAEIHASVKAFPPGVQVNPGRRPTPRWVAADVLAALQELTAGIPVLQRRLWPSSGIIADLDAKGNAVKSWRLNYTFAEAMYAAFIMEKPMPTLPSSRRPAWAAINAAAQSAADVMTYARAGNIVAAWRSAAAASHSCGFAEELLRPAWLKQQEKTVVAAARAEGRKLGAERTRAQMNLRRTRAIALYRAGTWNSKDEAAAAIAPQLGVTVATARGYLNGVSKA